VSWIDSLLHLENYKQGTAGKLSKESRTIPSIVRQAQYENLKALIKRARRDKDFIPKWLAVEEDNVFRKRKKFNTLISLDGHKDMDLKSAAQQIECQILNFQRTFFRKLKYLIISLLLCPHFPVFSATFLNCLSGSDLMADVWDIHDTKVPKKPINFVKTWWLKPASCFCRLKFITLS